MMTESNTHPLFGQGRHPCRSPHEVGSTTRYAGAMCLDAVGQLHPCDSAGKVTRRSASDVGRFTARLRRRGAAPTMNAPVSCVVHHRPAYEAPLRVAAMSVRTILTVETFMSGVHAESLMAGDKSAYCRPRNKLYTCGGRYVRAQ